MIYPLYNCLKIASDLDIKWVIRFIKRNLEMIENILKIIKLNLKNVKQ